MKVKKLLKWLLSIFVLLILITGIASYFYINNYYHASSNAIEIVEHFSGNSSEDETASLDNEPLVFAPENPKAGLIFYPGGKVQYESYAPLMNALAKQDILCVLVHMPGNLAVLDINAADGIKEQFPNIQKWYIGGHSLGGSMAASYVSKHTDEFDGLILLASYSTEDLSDCDLDVISIFGTEDQVLNQESYAKYKSNLPSAFTEVIIEGGCHAFFGDYGPQDGDGTPAISREEQINETVDSINTFFSTHNKKQHII